MVNSRFRNPIYTIIASGQATSKLYNNIIINCTAARDKYKSNRKYKYLLARLLYVTSETVQRGGAEKAAQCLYLNALVEFYSKAAFGCRKRRYVIFDGCWVLLGSSTGLSDPYEQLEVIKLIWHEYVWPRIKSLGIILLSP